jgi:hypothetical protein
MSTLHGLQLDGDSPAERRQAVLDASKQELIDAIVELALEHRDAVADWKGELAEVACLPAGELVASPFGFRASLMGAQQGAAAVHHELRVPITGPTPSADSSLFDPSHGMWDRGVRHIGKYQSFRHDEPFLVYNPNHMSKWTPHEMLHRALGFVFDRDMSRWEFYLASRLNELVPVVHWYGTDEILRLRHDGFDKDRDARSPGAQLRQAEWLELTKTDLKDRARGCAHLLVETVERFEEEIEAVYAELDSGYMQEVPHAHLDSSSDALAYVGAHYDRIMSAPVRSVLENVVPEEFRFSTVGDYLEATEELFDELLFGELSWDRDEAEDARNERAIWDLLLRGALHPELDEECLVRGVEGAPEGFWTKLSNVRVLISESLDSEAKEEVNASGFAESLNRSLHVSGPRAPLALRSAEEIAEGLSSIVPVAMEVVTSEQIADFASLHEDSRHWRRNRLWKRFHEYLQSESELALAELVLFEASLYQDRPPNHQVERLSSWPDDNANNAEEWSVIRSESYQRYAFIHDVPEWHSLLAQGETVDVPARRQTDILIGALDGAPCVVGICPACATVFDMLESTAMTLGDMLDILHQGDLTIFGMEELAPERPIDWVFELAEAGAIGLVPPVRE